MKLVPSDKRSGERRIAYYRSPMDPSVRSDKPAKDAMGMDFVPVYEDELTGGPAVAGRAMVTLSPERQQMLGVRSEEVRQQRLARVIRTVGRIAVDERRLHHIHTKYDGYVEHLHVDFTGKFVKAGEPLLSIYSPDLVATQQEYLLAYRAQKQMAQSGIPSVAQGSLDLLEVARQRLLLWDIRPADIEVLEKAGQVKRTLDLHSDVSGYVVQKMAFHGMRVTPADTLFDIADLSRVWVLADVYESDLPLVRVGMGAGGDLHRPRALLDDGDDGRLEASVFVPAQAALVLVFILGARVAEGARPPPDLAGPHLRGGAGRGDGPGAADPGDDERLDDADQEQD